MSDFLNSLDPRVNRLNIPNNFETSYVSEDEMDQFITYEVFVQPKVNKPYQHEGIVHAPTIDMAFLFAKEQFSRRGVYCSGVWVVKTSDVQVSPISENDEDIYDFIHKEIMDGAKTEKAEAYDVFHLRKRGKQHIHVGALEATSFEEALFKAKDKFREEKPVLNIWVSKSEEVLKIEGEDFIDIWETLPDKKYRDATDYRAIEKIKKFKAEQNA